MVHYELLSTQLYSLKSYLGDLICIGINGGRGGREGLTTMFLLVGCVYTYCLYQLV